MLSIKENINIRTQPHQSDMILATIDYPLIEYFFLVGGYNAGKSYLIALFMLILAIEYDGKYIRVGVGGGTITMFEATTINQFFVICQQAGIPYSYSKQDHIISIGTTEFVVLSMELPEKIYAYNFNIFLADELDELTQEKALAVYKAINERTRRPLPAGETREPRSAYSCFFTTAQGYRGTYQIVEEIKQRGEPYYIRHAKSADNEFTDKTWLARMTSIYNDMERRVFLEGEFANLTTGRVYYGYDESANRLKVKPFEIEPNDLIRIGQDFNAGYSRGCAVVKRGGVLHVVHLFDFAEIGHAPTMIRTAFPPHVIEWYPDASSMEIVTGYSKEIREANIQCRIGTINPSVIDRIYFINKLFETRRLFLWPNCGALSMALKVRQFNDKGDPEKGKGPEAPDHWADSLEYVIWRIVARDPEFQALWGSSQIGRRSISDRLIT